MRKKNKKLLKQKKNLWYNNHIKKYILSPLDKLLTKLNNPTILTNNYLSNANKWEAFNDATESRFLKKENKYILHTVKRMVKRCGSKILRTRHTGNGPERTRLNLRHLFFANNNLLKESNKFNLNLKTPSKTSENTWHFELLKKRNKLNSIERDKTALQNFMCILKSRDLRKLPLLKLKQLTVETSNLYYLAYKLINKNYKEVFKNEKNKPLTPHDKRVITSTISASERCQANSIYALTRVTKVNDCLWNLNLFQTFYENWNDIEMLNSPEVINDFLLELETDEKQNMFFIKKWKKLIKIFFKNNKVSNKNYSILTENTAFFLQMFDTWFVKIQGKKAKKINKPANLAKYLRTAKKFRIINRDLEKFFKTRLKK